MFQRFFIGFYLIVFGFPALAQEAKFSAESLIKSPITGVAGHEVLMSRVTIPANTALPRHYHPTEEFLYILTGEAYLQIDGRENQLLTAGMSAAIPAGAVHTAVTTSHETIALTYRVHPVGRPVRLPAPAEKE